MHVFAFESFGVRVRVLSNHKRLANRLESVVRTSLLNKISEIDPGLADHEFKFDRGDGKYTLVLNGEELGGRVLLTPLARYFESRVRNLVAANAKNYIFIHAGVVAWNGAAVIFPADSYSGKSTLVAELVKKGAEYYSDEYAVIDSKGLVHPFARPLAIRDSSRVYQKKHISATSLGGVIGRHPIPPAIVIFTQYRKNGRWRPIVLSPGNGMMEMIRQTIPLQNDPEYSLYLLKLIADRAIIAKSLRPDIRKCVNEILYFVDKFCDLAKID